MDVVLLDYERLIVLSVFREFEQEALRLLVEPILGSDLVSAVISDGEFVSLEHNGVGYFLTVRHAALPERRTIFRDPFVVGRADEVLGMYLVFVENGELMLECAPVTPSKVPEEFRDMAVSISIENVTGAAN